MIFLRLVCIFWFFTLPVTVFSDDGETNNSKSILIASDTFLDYKKHTSFIAYEQYIDSKSYSLYIGLGYSNYTIDSDNQKFTINSLLTGFRLYHSNIFIDTRMKLFQGNTGSDSDSSEENIFSVLPSFGVRQYFTNAISIEGKIAASFNNYYASGRSGNDESWITFPIAEFGLAYHW